MNIAEVIAHELGVKASQVNAAITLLEEGATVPFIARYRKEATGGLNDTQLRHLEHRLVYLRELEERRAVILRSVKDQGKLTEVLEGQILAAITKTELEDRYLPYKPKRRTKAQIAREAGLEPLARRILEDPKLDPENLAASYVDPEKGINDTAAALDGARRILMEQFSEDATLLGRLREYLWQHGILRSQLIAGKEEEGRKFADYFDYREAIGKIPSHRALALFRGRNEGILTLSLEVDHAQGMKQHPCEVMLAKHFSLYDQGRPADSWLRETIHWVWKVKLHTSLSVDLYLRLREQAEATAIAVFSRNLQDLLLAAPAGLCVTMGLDPGLRTGVKVAVVDKTGKLLETTTVYPHAPQNRWREAMDALARLAKRHRVELISLGNGTASRETDRLATELIKQYPELKLQKVMVSEAGASVYSASEIAAQEFPDVDVALRGAVSIARRLQDPLAELVKIDPKSIGVGQYQHDVNQRQLARTLDSVVEDCVNAVGVDVNTASGALLSHVSGLTPTLAHTIIEYRNAHGAFSAREVFKQVPRLGEKTFEQAAGFLRIVNGENALDASAVHPEAYPVIQRIIEYTGRDIRSLIGDAESLRTLDPKQFTDEKFGLPTVKDILKELEKPGRDPRPEFKTATFKEGVETLEDLKPGLVLEGVVTNVTHFGAFVDIGVHQDGLVHISALADHFVKDPHKVVSVGALVKVKVVEVDLKRKRIALTMRLDDEVLTGQKAAKSPTKTKPKGKVSEATDKPLSALAQALAKARGDSK
jgi:uncharacterized protein